MIYRNKKNQGLYQLLTTATNVTNDQLPDEMAVYRPIDVENPTTYVRRLSEFYVKFEKVEVQDKPSTLLMYEQLTPREKEVAQLIMTGVPNKIIARMLEIGIRTVKEHVSNIFQKTKIKTRAELASFMTVVALNSRRNHGIF